MVYRLPTLTTTQGDTPLNGKGCEMAMTKIHVLAVAAGLLLAVSGPSIAAKRTLQKSDPKSAAKSQSRATKSGGSTVRPYSRDPDPYAPGVNRPKGA